MSATPAYFLFHGAETVDGASVESFTATEHTASPWGAEMQHGGPVAGLLTRALEQHGAREESRLSRVTVDLLGAVPLGELRVRATTLRPGRRIELLAAELEAPVDGSWRAVARAQAWRLATQDTSAVVNDPFPHPVMPEHDVLGSEILPAVWQMAGFVPTLRWRAAEGLRLAPGEPNTVWLNLTMPLVAGEETSPLAAALTIADVANGIGARLDPRSHTFLNTEMTVHLFRPPSGEWFGLEAETAVGPDGVGLSQALLHDVVGPIGRISQSLLVEARR
ncbi:thioesterase family protein [Nocardioides sp. Bht2]|uniref:thioesterase family protein n=1 Tax=Nocardioides sp. Bht2 TaxID=3392297 RepID=UPI0039B5B167